MRRANQLRNTYPRSFTGPFGFPLAATSEKSKAPEGAAEMVPKEALGAKERGRMGREPLQRVYVRARM